MLATGNVQLDAEQQSSGGSSIWRLYYKRDLGLYPLSYIGVQPLNGRTLKFY